RKKSEGFHMHIAEGAENLLDQLIAWRRHLHANPELSFHEKETSRFVVEQLKQIPNIEIQENIGGYGVVATLSAGEGPTVAVRADMDALPIEEENELDYRSTKDGIMHACGHDAHTSMLLGAAHLLG